MKLSFCSANYGWTPLEKVISRAGQLGFDGLEITVQYHAHPSLGVAQRKEIKGWLKKAGIECAAVHFIYDKTVKIASDDPADIKHSVMYNKSVVDVAADLGTDVVVLGGGGSRSFKPGQDRAEIEKIMVDIFAQSGEYAKEKGVYIGLEALNRYETNFINTLADSKAIAQKVNCPNVKVMGDTFHMNIEEESLPDAIRNAGDDLIHLHLVDSNRLSPGEGHMDTKAVVQALRDIDYKRYCSFEVFYISPDLVYFDSFQEADKHMVFGKEYMDKILAQ